MYLFLRKFLYIERRKIPRPTKKKIKALRFTYITSLSAFISNHLNFLGAFLLLTFAHSSSFPCSYIKPQTCFFLLRIRLIFVDPELCKRALKTNLDLQTVLDYLVALTSLQSCYENIQKELLSPRKTPLVCTFLAERRFPLKAQYLHTLHIHFS